VTAPIPATEAPILATTAAIVATGVRKSYRDAGREVEVLRGVDLTVEPAELVAIVGPSGSGKSTLLHLLGALDRPDAGTIALEGQRLDGLDENRLADLRNRRLGFVFQFHQLLPDFTALENVMMPGRIAGQAGAVTRRRAEELLDEVGLRDRASHFPSQLSGGERQRVALCRALLLEPPILLADEPTGNLDPASGEQVLERLLDLRARHRTTAVLVTHNPVIAARCGRVLRLDGGVLRALPGA
jgi:lipoprotein-releasing system ATP-binding protein